MGILNFFRNFSNRERVVANSDEAPYDSLYGKNAKLEDARREYRKIQEKAELEHLKKKIKAHKIQENHKRWVDNGGFFNHSTINPNPSKQNSGPIKANLFSNTGLTKSKGQRGIV